MRLSPSGRNNLAGVGVVDAQVVAIAVVDVPVQVAVATLSGEIARGFSLVGGRLKYLGNTVAFVHVSFQTGILSAAGTILVTPSIAVIEDNGIAIATAIRLEEVTTLATARLPVSVSGVQRVEPGESISFMLANNTDAEDIDITAGTLSVFEI